MRAIWKRELKSYFQTVTGWLFIAATLALFGLYFYVYNMYYGSTDISSNLSAVTFLFLVTVPILTMRTLAEERKNKTDQLILTSPVSVEKVVLAKYLATGTVFTISVAVMCLAPLIMSAYGNVAFAKSYVGVLGFWLYGDLYCHWNLCIFTDRKYCNFCSINLCISLCGISDDRNYQSDFTEWKYYYKDFRLL